MPPHSNVLSSFRLFFLCSLAAWTTSPRQEDPSKMCSPRCSKGAQSTHTGTRARARAQKHSQATRTAQSVSGIVLSYAAYYLFISFAVHVVLSLAALSDFGAFLGKCLPAVLAVLTAVCFRSYSWRADTHVLASFFMSLECKMFLSQRSR